MLLRRCFAPGLMWTLHIILSMLARTAARLGQGAAGIQGMSLQHGCTMCAHGDDERTVCALANFGLSTHLCRVIGGMVTQQWCAL